MSYTELAKQPAWWVMRMKTWKEAQAAAEQKRMEQERIKAKIRRRH